MVCSLCPFSVHYLFWIFWTLYQKKDVVVAILEREACDVNVRDNAGYTPLHECCISKEGNVEVARKLLEFGADVNATASGGIR